MSSRLVTIPAISVRFHLGKEGLKSGKEVTPGQSCSPGVPRMLSHVSVFVVKSVVFMVIPEDLEDLVNL